MSTNNGNKNIGGKVPLSQKKSAPHVGTWEDVFGNPMAVSAELQKKLTEMGLVWRYIDASCFSRMGGSHERLWRPIKRSECGMLDTVPSFGNDPDGYFRYGSMVLAVRPKELNEKHKALLKHDAERMAGIQKKHAQELRDYARSTGVDVKISEGYEEQE